MLDAVHGKRSLLVEAADVAVVGLLIEDNFSTIPVSRAKDYVFVPYRLQRAILQQLSSDQSAKTNYVRYPNTVA